MVANLKCKLALYFSLLKIAAQIDLAWLLRDAKYAITAMIADTISNLSLISGVYLMTLKFGGIGSMSSDEVLFMLAFSTCVTGLFNLFGSGNNVQISRVIGRGQLEHFFIQPISLRMQLLTGGFIPFTGSNNLVIGIILMILAIKRLALPINILWFLSLFGYLLAALSLIVARAYFVSTLAFYEPVAAEEVASLAIDSTALLGTFPLSGMPKALVWPLLTLLPEGLMAWLPSLNLLSKPPFHLAQYYPFVYVIVLIYITKLLFLKGMNYYVRRGSNRYLPYGFRR